MGLYVARWPDGTAWIVSADSLAGVADVLDEADDPGACEVQPFDGPFAVELRLPKESNEANSSLEFSQTDAPDTNYEMQRRLLELAYPHVAAALEHADDEGEIPDADWQAAVADEMKRELVPSTDWADGVKEWWEAFSGGDADRTAALRDMADVTIPGEPKPETPEQRKLFEAAKQRIMERTGKFLSEPLPDGGAKSGGDKTPRKPQKPSRPRKRK